MARPSSLCFSKDCERSSSILPSPVADESLTRTVGYPTLLRRASIPPAYIHHRIHEAEKEAMGKAKRGKLSKRARHDPLGGPRSPGGLKGAAGGGAESASGGGGGRGNQAHVLLQEVRALGERGRAAAVSVAH